jgi:hypothetical protein
MQRHASTADIHELVTLHTEALSRCTHMWLDHPEWKTQLCHLVKNTNLQRKEIKATLHIVWALLEPLILCGLLLALDSDQRNKAKGAILSAAVGARRSRSSPHGVPPLVLLPPPPVPEPMSTSIIVALCFSCCRQPHPSRHSAGVDNGSSNVQEWSSQDNG